MHLKTAQTITRAHLPYISLAIWVYTDSMIHYQGKTIPIVTFPDAKQITALWPVPNYTAR